MAPLRSAPLKSALIRSAPGIFASAKFTSPSPGLRLPITISAAWTSVAGLALTFPEVPVAGLSLVSPEVLRGAEGKTFCAVLSRTDAQRASSTG